MSSCLAYLPGWYVVSRPLAAGCRWTRANKATASRNRPLWCSSVGEEIGFREYDQFRVQRCHSRSRVIKFNFLDLDALSPQVSLCVWVGMWVCLHSLSLSCFLPSSQSSFHRPNCCCLQPHLFYSLGPKWTDDCLDLRTDKGQAPLQLQQKQTRRSTLSPRTSNNFTITSSHHRTGLNNHLQPTVPGLTFIFVDRQSHTHPLL